MNETVDLHSMNEAQMRQMLQRLIGELKHKQTLLDKLTYEMAILKRLKFATKTEALNADQRSLLDDALEEDLQAVDEEIDQLLPAAERSPRQLPKRLPLPAQLPRQEFTHEPDVTECCGQAMRRMGEDVAEKLDYTPGVFTVHRHVCGKWVCACCQTLKQQPVDPPPRQNTCRLDRTKNPGAAMKDDSGSIRTGIQRQSGGQVAAAGERLAGGGLA